MKYSEMKKAAHDWFADQKLWLSMMVNPESINRNVDVAEGFIDALRLLGIYSADQAKEAYKELRAAHDEAMKKAAPGAGNTESGSKGGHPAKDDSLSHIQSVDEKTEDVKMPQASAREWADTLLKFISAMRHCHIDDGRIVETLVRAMARPQEGDCR